MINRLKNMLSQVMYTPSMGQVQTTKSANYNPFENPFIKSNEANRSYAVNRPVKGGYFAGYYNGQPNIVGKRLFIEA